MHLVDGIQLERNDEYVRLVFSSFRTVLSSAVLNGGFHKARQILNLKVAQAYSGDETPQQTLARCCSQFFPSSDSIGLMTAASMRSFELAHCSVGTIQIFALGTVGLQNARAAGDPADVEACAMHPDRVGTINLVVGTNAKMTEAAMVEAVMIVTEAKSRVLSELDIRSAVSGEIATGTGTDAIAIVSGDGPEEIVYCGKHVDIGEKIAQCVMTVIRSSIMEK